MHRHTRGSLARFLLIAASPSPLRGWGCPHCIVIRADHRLSSSSRCERLGRTSRPCDCSDSPSS
ncbi:hypothetical protein DQP58_08975 [Mycobacterium colombiense]|uniref:Uncharacterized protein n=1 Tax=Mycobacterium colombiense TaxID=339268 RepID=A0A329KMK9_9MYCO|nr:hypothetical protein DQP58_08975 [Mycobacterium colombiense]